MKLRGPDGTQHSKTFTTRRAATDYEAKQRTAVRDGAFIAPRAGTVPLTSLADSWMAPGARRESTQVRNRSIVTNHILPGLGAERAVRSVTRADCQQLVDGWSAAGFSTEDGRPALRHTAGPVQFAVDAEMIARNPATRLRVPQAKSVVRPGLDAGALADLAEELGPVQATFMWCGEDLRLRWAEAAGLTRSPADG